MLCARSAEKPMPFGWGWPAQQVTLVHTCQTLRQSAAASSQSSQRMSKVTCDATIGSMIMNLLCCNVERRSSGSIRADSAVEPTKA